MALAASAATRGRYSKKEFTLTFTDTVVPKGVTFEPANPVVRNPGEVPKFTIRAAKDAAPGDFAIRVRARVDATTLDIGQLDLSVDPAGEAAREQQPAKPRRLYDVVPEHVMEFLFAREQPGKPRRIYLPADETRHVGEVLTNAGGKLVMKSKDGTEHSYTLADNPQITCYIEACKLEDLKAGMIVRVTAKKAKPQEATRIEAVDPRDGFMAHYIERERQNEQQEIDRQKKVQQDKGHLQGTWLVVSSQTGDEKEPLESESSSRVTT
jgi:hypothetical protein